MQDAVNEWLSPPATLQLAENDLHVWRAYLDQAEYDIQKLWPVLAADEQRKAERLRFPIDRAHYIAARTALRFILSRYLLLEPQQIHFGYNSYGKPALDQAFHRDKLCFNLSHSQGLALYAIAYQRQVGIDLEYLRVDFSWAEIAERFFSPQEKTALRTIPAEMRYQAFFNCWTRKEAYIKARGEGLSHPLDQFDVSLRPGEPAVLLHSEIPQEASRWSLQELLPDPAYAAALAAEGHIWHVTCWQWDGLKAD